MKKTIIATALATIIAIPAANAAEVYNNNGNTVSITGKVAVAAVKTSKEDTAMANNGSRIGFDFSHQLTNGWKATGEFEWGVNGIGDKAGLNAENGQVSASDFSNPDDELFSNRYANIGLHHDVYGSVIFGKLHGAYYDAVSGTDEGIYWGGSASGFSGINNGGLNGTNRADKAIQYRNKFGDVSVAVQMQLQHESDTPNAQIGAATLTKLEYDYTYGASVVYQVTDQLKLTAAGNIGEYKAHYTVANVAKKKDLTDSIYAVGTTWGSLDNNGLYLAANFNKNKYHNVTENGELMPNAWGGELYAAYTFDNIRPYILSGRLSAKNFSEYSTYNSQNLIAGVNYQWDSNVSFWVEGKKDYSDIILTNGQKMSRDNGAAVGVTYAF